MTLLELERHLIEQKQQNCKHRRRVHIRTHGIYSFNLVTCANFTIDRMEQPSNQLSPFAMLQHVGNGVFISILTTVSTSRTHPDFGQNEHVSVPNEVYVTGSGIAHSRDFMLFNLKYF